MRRKQLSQTVYQIIMRLLFFAAFLLIDSRGNHALGQGLDERLRLGQTHANRGQWKEAEETLRPFRQAAPNSVEAIVLYAQSLYHLNQPFDAVLVLEELLGAQPDAVPALKLYSALLSAVVRDEAKAEEVLLRCSRLAPNDSEVWQALGSYYLERQKSDAARRCFEQATRLAPAEPAFVAGLAAAHGQLNRPQAVAEFKRAIKLNARSAKPNPSVYLMYAEYLLKQNRFAASIPLYTKALLLDPHSSNAYYGRAVAHEKLKILPRAEADALAALRESEKRRDAHQLLLRIYRAQKDQEKMLKYVGLIEQLTEEEAARQAVARALRTSLRAAEPLLREGKYAEAAPHYEEIIRLLPTFYESYFALGVCYSQTNRLQQAETSFKKYLSFQPLSADGHAALGILLLQQNRREEAQSKLERALQLDSSLSEARDALSWIKAH